MPVRVAGEPAEAVDDAGVFLAAGAGISFQQSQQGTGSGHQRVNVGNNLGSPRIVLLLRPSEEVMTEPFHRFP